MARLTCFLIATLVLASPAAWAQPATPPAAEPASPPTTDRRQEAVAIPADGKYPNVLVEGVTVPMIQIMKGGTIVLVDTDGKKPRSWEEQFKAKSATLAKGHFDLHKTDTNKDGKFDDEAVDRQGRWRMDEKGNIVRE